ncbi:MAG: TetR/AcrR family transcriptional regulator [Pseudomonadota bacterium]
MARTRAADYDDRREAILDKAAQLFADKGFQGASIADLARACETSKSLVYHYFPSKEDLLFEVMSAHVDALLDAVTDLPQQDDAPAHRLRILVRAFMRIYAGAAAHHKVLLDELRNLPEERRSEIVAKQREVIVAIESLLVAINPGATRQASLARVSTMLFFGMINWTSHWFDPAGPMSAEELADRATSLMLDGLTGLSS